MASFSLGTEEMSPVVSIFFMKFQAFSMGFKSRELPRQSIILKGFSSRSS
jgi:hypothetical protein